MKAIKKILVGLDGSNSAIQATNYALNLAHILKARIEIVAIINFAIGNIDAGIFPKDVEKRNKTKAKSLIEKIKNEHPNIKINDIETVGIPEKEIIKAIKNWKVDLLILGHHTHSFLEKLFKKSVEKKLIDHIECPILIIPENINNYK